MSGPKVLLYDVECSPIVCHTWSLRDLHVGLNQVVADPHILGVGFKWYGGKPAKYLSVNKLGREEMLHQTWSLLDESDVAVGYNNAGFDNKWVAGELARIGLTPPSPFKTLDLYRVVRANFRYPSFKLDYVAQSLLGMNKLATGGHDLWVQTMAGDPKADARMAKYCRRDVELLEPLLDVLRPWAGNAVNWAAFEDDDLACSKCGSAEFLSPKGSAHTATRSYKQYICKPSTGGCGGWTRDGRGSEVLTRAVGVTR